MADHLKADLGRITQIAQTLRALGDEFSSLTRIADVGSAAGNAGLASALADFANGWSDERGKLTSQVRSLSRAADKAAAEYTQTDNTLASRLGGAAPGGGPAGSAGNGSAGKGSAGKGSAGKGKG